MATITHHQEIGAEDVRFFGSNNLYARAQTGVEYSFDLEFNPIDEKLINYGVANPSGTGTIEKSITVLMSKKIGGTETYIIYTGCRCDSTDIEMTNDSAITVSQTWYASDRIVSTSHGLTGTPTFAANPSTLPWFHPAAGANAITINSVVYKGSSITVSVAQNLERIQPIGHLTPIATEATQREVSGDFDVWLTGTVLNALSKNFTAVPMEVILKPSPGWKLVLTNVQLGSKDEEDDASGTESTMESYSYSATDVVMTAIP